MSDRAEAIVYLLTWVCLSPLFILGFVMIPTSAWGMLQALLVGIACLLIWCAPWPLWRLFCLRREPTIETIGRVDFTAPRGADRSTQVHTFSALGWEAWMDKSQTRKVIEAVFLVVYICLLGLLTYIFVYGGHSLGLVHVVISLATIVLMALFGPDNWTYWSGLIVQGRNPPKRSANRPRRMHVRRTARTTRRRSSPRLPNAAPPTLH